MWFLPVLKNLETSAPQPFNAAMETAARDSVSVGLYQPRPKTFRLNK